LGIGIDMFEVASSVAVLKKKLAKFPAHLQILGSGWNSIMKEVKSEIEISYKELFGIEARVPGHEGKLVIGTIDEKQAAFMVGRVHTYEGYTSEEVTRPIQVFAQLGLKEVVVTAAAGALNEKYHVGDFIVLSDIITMFCPSPLTGPQFIDLSEAFDPELRLRALRSAHASKIPVHEGVYCYTRGPHFESPADKMMLRQLGADVVGMSTVPETIMARSLGIKVLGLSYVTNLAFVKHDHHDVLAAAHKGSAQMVEVLRSII